MDIFNRTLCKEIIKLEPKFININFKKEIKNRLERKVEGVCTKHGYIKNNSIEIYKITPGLLELSTLSGNIIYTVYFYADICNPVIGSIIDANISNINRFGILAEAGYTINNTTYSILEIIIAKNSVNIQSEIDLELLKIGDKIKVELIGKKFELGEKKLLGIGRVIKDSSAKESVAVNLNNQEEIDDENEEVYDINSESSEEDELEKDDDDEKDGDVDDDDDEKHGGSEFFSDDENFFSEEDQEIDYIDDDLSSISIEEDDLINDE